MERGDKYTPAAAVCKAREREALLALLVQKCSLYWYKRYAHTPAAALPSARRERERPRRLYSVYSLYWYKSANTDV
jgi:hypothetical protein